MPWGMFTVGYYENHQIFYASLDGIIPRGALQRGWPQLSSKLQQYAAGEPVSFSDLTLALTAFPQFTSQVMTYLQHNCAWGSTCTYGEVALAIGKPKAARAIGQVMARNQIPLFVP